MTHEETLNGNKLIAEFMGVKIGIDKFSWRPGTEDPLEEKHLNYHKSWDWLMPVVEKIESMDYAVHIHNNGCAIQKGLLHGYIIDESDDSKIQATYKAIIQFITYYNNQENLEPYFKIPQPHDTK